MIVSKFLAVITEVAPTYMYVFKFSGPYQWFSAKDM